MKSVNIFMSITIFIVFFTIYISVDKVTAQIANHPDIFSQSEDSDPSSEKIDSHGGHTMIPNKLVLDCKCNDGYVLRQAFPGDKVCVTPAIDQQTSINNAPNLKQMICQQQKSTYVSSP